jgi:hypothetical protein
VAGNGVYVWGAQVELGSTATDYQKTTTIYDTTEAGVADLHYLQFDGVDDSLATAAIDFSATDKMSVFAGVRKLSDAARAMLLETGAAIGTGGFNLEAPDGASNARYYMRLNNTGACATPSSFAAGQSDVLSLTYDMAGTTLATECIARIDGVAQTMVSGGWVNATGSFVSNVLNIGRRGGASLPFNGNLYSLIVRGALSDAAQIAAAESYVNSKTKAYS